MTGAETYTVTYTYDLNNRLLRKVQTGDSPSTTTFTYDRNGNQLTQTSGSKTKTLTYDRFNHLVRVQSPGMTAVYTYRADGLRHSKSVNGVVTTHVWNMGNIVLERNGGGQVVNRFHRGLGHLINSDNHGFYLFNVRGDVVQRVDRNGDILHTYRYDAFGNQLNEEEVNTNPFRYAGEYHDFERGFIYLRARFYNPLTGRMISEGPYWTVWNMQISAVKLQAANLYVYAINNPIAWIDPSGLSASRAAQAIYNSATATERIFTAANAAARAASQTTVNSSNRTRVNLTSSVEDLGGDFSCDGGSSTATISLWGMSASFTLGSTGVSGRSRSM